MDAYNKHGSRFHYLKIAMNRHIDTWPLVNTGLSLILVFAAEMEF